MSSPTATLCAALVTTVTISLPLPSTTAVMLLIATVAAGDPEWLRNDPTPSPSAFGRLRASNLIGPPVSV